MREAEKATAASRKRGTCSPQNYIYPVLDEESVDYVLNEYETAKRSVPPIIASDGSFIRREGYWDDEMDDEALFEYYVNDVVDKEPAYTYKDPNYPLAAGYEAWLDDIYGRTEMGKFWDYMETLDGIQDALDVIGLVCNYADLINMFISICRLDGKRAFWSFIGAFSVMSPLFARAGRAATRTSKTIAGKVITGAANAAAGARTVVKELELTISALGEEFEHFKKLLQNMVEDIKKTGKTILETPFSIRLEKVYLQYADGGYVGFGGYRIIINFADDVEGAVGGGRKTEKVLGGGLGGGSNAGATTSRVTSPNQMNRQIERGQAPRGVRSVHNPDPQYAEPHVHFDDGTSITRSGNVHDASHGTPNLTKEILEWLHNNGWCLDID